MKIGLSHHGSCKNGSNGRGSQHVQELRVGQWFGSFANCHKKIYPFKNTIIRTYACVRSKKHLKKQEECFSHLLI